MKHIKIFIAVALMLSCRTFAAHAQNYITFINDGIKLVAHVNAVDDTASQLAVSLRLSCDGHGLAVKLGSMAMSPSLLLRPITARNIPLFR